MADSMERVTLSASPDLVEELDEVIETGQYGNRSEAIRDALRQFLTDYYWEHEPERTLQGSIVIVYDHAATGVNDRLLELQHDANELIVSVQHVHFDHHRCLETLAVEGPGDEIHSLVDNLRSIKGVQQVRLTTL